MAGMRLCVFVHSSFTFHKAPVVSQAFASHEDTNTELSAELSSTPLAPC